MSIEIKINRKGFTKLLDDLFKGVDKRRDGYCTLIPLTTNHIKINGVNHFFGSDEKYFLVYNHYGQMSIEVLQGDKLNECHSWNTRLHIDWNVKDLNELWIDAPNKYGNINPKTNDYYYELFVFKLR